MTHAQPPAPTVVVQEPETIGTLYGPDGKPLGTVVAQQPKPFGFAPSEEKD